MAERILEGRDLLKTAVSDPNEFDKYNELLSYFFKGLPVELLRPLLESGSERAISGGLFIVDELGAGAGSLLDNVAVLTSHQSAHIRLSAYGALTACITDQHEAAYAHVLRGINDADPGCRQLAMLLTMRVSEGRLSAGHRALLNRGSDAALRTALGPLLNEDSASTSEVRSWIQAREGLIRRVGAIAAGRRGASDASLLEFAVASSDTDVQRSAASQLRFYELCSAHKRRRGG